MPVLSGNPGPGLVRMSPLTPFPEHIPHSVIQIVEYLLRYDCSMIVRPADGNGIQSIYEVLLFPCFRSFDYVTDLTIGVINRLLRWLYQEFPFVLTEVPAQEVKTNIYMCDMSLLRR